MDEAYENKSTSYVVNQFNNGEDTKTELESVGKHKILNIRDYKHEQNGQIQVLNNS